MLGDLEALEHLQVVSGVHPPKKELNGEMGKGMGVWFLEYGCPKMKGLQWKSLFKWMIGGVPPFWETSEWYFIGLGV